MKAAERKNHRQFRRSTTSSLSLRGNWRDEHLFALREALELFDAYGAQVQACDREIESLLARLGTRTDPPPAAKRSKRSGRNAPRIDARTLLFRVCGVDLTQIEALI